ncbi:TetR/AcrR family transcriptional regulator [Gordonia liuliyuniae]|uniref:TetR/AcrR family transcriptional regulator n=1 Tax=Gordonia liuliyuniae TaxID=2911517 RepID=A0ABS9INJ7_9ACTN|nr:TetR/AcrR family transcriptional regulator [Gordonia liuliyuniae]MCF8587124.1 TetR/AcrR family transcriptional regulator [Gordonia liuliyuniae]
MTETRSYRGRSIDERRTERRERFLDAALTLFGTTGYAATAVPAVCKAAGLSSRQFYELFSDREDLLRALYDRVQDESTAAVSEALDAALSTSGITVEEVLDAGIRAFVEYYASSTERTRVSFVEVVGVSPRFEDHRHARRGEWTTLLDSVTTLGHERGLALSASPPLVWSGYIGAVNALIVERSVNPDVTVDELMDAMRRLLRPGAIG